MPKENKIAKVINPVQNKLVHSPVCFRGFYYLYNNTTKSKSYVRQHAGRTYKFTRSGFRVCLKTLK